MSASPVPDSALTPGASLADRGPALPASRETPGPATPGRVPAPERGSALVAVVVVSLIVASAAIGAWSVARAHALAAHRRTVRERAARLAGAAAAATAGWFEAQERRALIAPPSAADVDRSLRRIDPDGDGVGSPWSAAPAGWRMVYKDGAARLFRPPDGPAPADRFVGTPDGPDVLLARGSTAEPLLEALAAALGAGDGERITRVALFGPPPRAGPLALASVEVRAEARMPGSPPIAATARAEILRVPWGRLDRPLTIVDGVRLEGDVSWGHGEALIGGDLDAPASIVDSWPGGIPWLGPDAPLRDDADGDGTPDDADGDGTADLAAWRALAGPVPDPWWRARVGGRWPGVFDAPRPCEQPYPFGPRRSPPVAPTTTEERSGLFLACAIPRGPRALLDAWTTLAASGVRGVVRAVEDAGAPGTARIDGVGPTRPVETLMPREGGVLWLEPAAGRTSPLRVTLDGLRGALLVPAGALDLVPGVPAEMEARAPGGPADTRGADRRPDAGDDRLEPLDADGRCDAFTVGPWVDAAAPPGPAAWRACGTRELHLGGLVAVDGALALDGPLQIRGALRARSLVANGGAGAVRIEAGPSALFDPGLRPGPPGAPRVLAVDLRESP